MISRVVSKRTFHSYKSYLCHFIDKLIETIIFCFLQSIDLGEMYLKLESKF